MKATRTLFSSLDGIKKRLKEAGMILKKEKKLDFESEMSFNRRWFELSVEFRNNRVTDFDLLNFLHENGPDEMKERDNQVLFRDWVVNKLTEKEIKQKSSQILGMVELDVEPGSDHYLVILKPILTRLLAVLGNLPVLNYYVHYLYFSGITQVIELADESFAFLKAYDLLVKHQVHDAKAYLIKSKWDFASFYLMLQIEPDMNPTTYRIQFARALPSDAQVWIAFMNQNEEYMWSVLLSGDGISTSRTLIAGMVLIHWNQEDEFQVARIKSVLMDLASGLAISEIVEHYTDKIYNNGDYLAFATVCFQIDSFYNCLNPNMTPMEHHKEKSEKESKSFVLAQNFQSKDVEKQSEIPQRPTVKDLPI